MGRTAVLLLTTMALAMLLSSGVALALNTVRCEEGAERCVGTDRPDQMRGTDGDDLMLGRDKGDTMKGFGGFDVLFGREGDDELFGGARQDTLLGGKGDDKLRGEDALDVYFFERSDWGQDVITDVAPPENVLLLPFRRGFDAAIATKMVSGSGPEVINAESGGTVQWDGDLIRVVGGGSGDDTVTGTETADRIFDEAGPDSDTGVDTDTITGAGGRDLLVVQDGDTSDTVTCGPGRDTVYFDEGTPGDVLVDPTDCEQQNPIANERESQQAESYRAQVSEEVPASILEGYRP